MSRFRKLPVEVEAVQFTGDNVAEIAQFLEWEIDHYQTGAADEVIIATLEGDMRASVGDWVIKGVAGEAYPCKPAVFEMTYEPVEES